MPLPETISGCSYLAITIKLSDAIVSSFRAPFVQLFSPNYQRQKKTNRVLVHRIHYSFSLSTSLRAGAPVLSICYYYNAHKYFFSTVLFFIFAFTIQPCLPYALATPSPVVSNGCWYIISSRISELTCFDLALEVTTDALQPPTLAIISPTPRTFTFPPTHNLADSSHISPSHSPFELDQINALPFHLQCILSSVMTASPQQFQRTLSPVMESPISASPISASPSQIKTHHRRKSSTSSTSSDEERRPRKGDSDYIKRPENAFILFRRKCCEDRQAAASEDIHDGRTKKERQADLSKTISQKWRCLTTAERRVWEDMAKARKKEHEAMYPDYVYRPQRSKDKAKGKKNDKADPKGDEASLDVGFILPTPSEPKGRSASAPTPSPYQAIVLPGVYQAAPSCPTSPSLLPMITQYAAQTGQPENCANDFDFLPDENFMPSSNQMNFEAGLDVSTLLGMNRFFTHHRLHTVRIHPKPSCCVSNDVGFAR